MKKLFCIVLLISCFCGCARLKGPAGVGGLAGAEAGAITAQVLTCTTLQGAAVGAVVGFVGVSYFEDDVRETFMEEEVDTPNQQ